MTVRVGAICWRRCALVLALLALTGCARTSEPPAVLRVTVATGGLTDDVAIAVPIGSNRALTVAHVVAGARSTRVGGKPARVVQVDRRLDLAVLEVRGLGAPRPRYGRGQGESTIHVLREGRPRAIDAEVERRVTVSLYDPQTGRTEIRPALELRASVLPGDSGAAVTDNRGRVVGIVFARAQEAPGRAWALDLAEVPSMLARSR